MTNNKSISVSSNRSWGDVAVDGLWPGLVGGLLMMLYLVVTGLLSGDQPLTVFGYFVPNSDLSPLAGLGTHLAVSAVHGTIFGLLTAVLGKRLSTARAMLIAGFGYAFLLWLTAWLIIIPSDLSSLGNIPSGHLLIAHLLFGAALGKMLASNRLD